MRYISSSTSTPGLVGSIAVILKNLIISALLVLSSSTCTWKGFIRIEQHQLRSKAAGIVVRLSKNRKPSEFRLFVTAERVVWCKVMTAASPECTTLPLPVPLSPLSLNTCTLS